MNINTLSVTNLGFTSICINEEEIYFSAQGAKDQLPLILANIVKNNKHKFQRIVMAGPHGSIIGYRSLVAFMHGFNWNAIIPMETRCPMEHVLCKFSQEYIPCIALNKYELLILKNGVKEKVHSSEFFQKNNKFICDISTINILNPLNLMDIKQHKVIKWQAKDLL